MMARLCIIFFCMTIYAAQAFGATLAEVESYLNSIRTLSADFSQLSASGETRYGKVNLQKPGKIRWEYRSPSKALIIGNGKNFVYHDMELEETTYLPAQSAMAAFLTRDIQFGPNLKVIKHVVDGQYTYIGVVDPQDEQNVEVVLHILNSPITLGGFAIMQDGQFIASVSFTNLKTGIALDKSLFVFYDPKFFQLQR